jgi:hypothetical protein
MLFQKKNWLRPNSYVYKKGLFHDKKNVLDPNCDSSHSSNFLFSLDHIRWTLIYLKINKLKGNFKGIQKTRTIWVFNFSHKSTLNHICGYKLVLLHSIIITSINYSKSFFFYVFTVLQFFALFIRFEKKN